jgi:hypothetical protein
MRKAWLIQSNHGRIHELICTVCSCRLMEQCLKGAGTYGLDANPENDSPGLWR